jgi:predicted Zn-dependent protease
MRVRLDMMGLPNGRGEFVNDTHPCQTLASAALAHARNLRCAATEVCVEHTCTRVVSWESAAVLSAVSLEPKERSTVSVRCHTHDGGVGCASGTASTEAAVKKLVSTAIKRAGEEGAMRSAGPAPRYSNADVGLGLLDRRYANLDDESREDVVNNNIRAVQDVTGADPVHFHYTEVFSHRRVVSSTGLDQFERTTRYTLSGAVKNGDHVIEQSVHSRHFADVASLPLGADLANQVIRYADAQPCVAGPTVLVLEPRVIAKIMQAVIPAFDRVRVQAGKSFIKERRRVGSEKLHLVDDAIQFGGVQTRAFDARGVPALDLPLIREGLVGALYMSVEEAEKYDGRSSGHESTGGLWPGNLLFRCGTRSRNMMFPDLGEFVILDELVVSDDKWFNTKTGSLKLTGHFFSSDSGSPPKYIGVQTIDTTFVDLWSGIQEVGNDQQRFGSVDVSTWIVDGLSLS